jgi:hypothetical protein
MARLALPEPLEESTFSGSGSRAQPTRAPGPVSSRLGGRGRAASTRSSQSCRSFGARPLCCCTTQSTVGEASVHKLASALASGRPDASPRVDVLNAAQPSAHEQSGTPWCPAIVPMETGRPWHLGAASGPPIATRGGSARRPPGWSRSRLQRPSTADLLRASRRPMCGPLPRRSRTGCRRPQTRLRPPG